MSEPDHDTAERRFAQADIRIDRERVEVGGTAYGIGEIEGFVLEPPSGFARRIPAAIGALGMMAVGAIHMGIATDTFYLHPDEKSVLNVFMFASLGLMAVGTILMSTRKQGGLWIETSSEGRIPLHQGRSLDATALWQLADTLEAQGVPRQEGTGAR